jgi:hypothetical protein
MLSAIEHDIFYNLLVTLEQAMRDEYFRKACSVRLSGTPL